MLVLSNDKTGFREKKFMVLHGPGQRCLRWIVTSNPLSIFALPYNQEVFLIETAVLKLTPLTQSCTGRTHPFSKTGNVAIHQLRNIWKRVVFLKRKIAKVSMWLSEEEHIIIIKESNPQNIFSPTFSIWTTPCGLVMYVLKSLVYTHQSASNSVAKVLCPYLLFRPSWH